MNNYNDIGIGKSLDWDRICHLLMIGLVASFLVLIADMLLGWGVYDEGLTGLEWEYSAYLGVSHRRLFWAALLGMIGIPLEGLCYFAIYRLIVPYSQKAAHLYRAGIFGYLIFGGCGVHVPCVAQIYFYQSMREADPERALEGTIRFQNYFLVPATVLLLLSMLLLTGVQIAAFLRGLTPLPRWCWIFCLPVGMAAGQLITLIGNYAIVNALSTGWISLGNIWMFGGLLGMAGKAERVEEKSL